MKSRHTFDNKEFLVNCELCCWSKILLLLLIITLLTKHLEVDAEKIRNATVLLDSIKKFRLKDWNIWWKIFKVWKHVCSYCYYEYGYNTILSLRLLKPIVYCYKSSRNIIFHFIILPIFSIILANLLLDKSSNLYCLAHWQ